MQYTSVIVFHNLGTHWPQYSRDFFFFFFFFFYQFSECTQVHPYDNRLMWSPHSGVKQRGNCNRRFCTRLFTSGGSTWSNQHQFIYPYNEAKFHRTSLLLDCTAAIAWIEKKSQQIEMFILACVIKQKTKKKQKKQKNKKRKPSNKPHMLWKTKQTYKMSK